MSVAARDRRPRSKGAIALARTGLTQEQIAEKLGCAREQVSYWLTGARKPGKAWRTAIELAFGIAPKLWDEYPEPEAPRDETPNANEDRSVRARAERFQRMLDDILERVENDSSATPHEKAKVIKDASAALAVLGRITGEAQEIGEQRILRLPAWRRIEDALATALVPFPKAARAVAEALEELAESVK